MNDQQIAETLAADSAIQVRFGVHGREVTTFAIGGELRALADINSTEALTFALKVLSDAQIPYMILGAGSNLLISDQGIQKWIIRLGSAFRTINERGAGDTVRIEVGGSYPVIALSRELSEKGYAGIAFAGGIPASLGGAVRMNAGAHGGEFSKIVQWADIVRADGSHVRLSKADLNYSYRHSSVAHSDVVVGAGLLLRRSTSEETMAQRAHCLEERRSRQPLTVPSAGSVFKNPSSEQSAGWLIEQCGLKGYRIGDVMISEKHANWIVNPLKKGKAQEVLDLIALCQERVERQFGIALHPEIISLF